MKMSPYRILPSEEGNWKIIDGRTGDVVARCPTRRDARLQKWRMDTREEPTDAVAASR